MTQSSDLQATIERLLTAPLPQLRREWQQHHLGIVLPSGLPRDLLVRGITWKLQEQEHGGFRPDILRQLKRMAGQLERSGELDLEREVQIKAGTRLVREWRGKTYRVLVLDVGYLFDEQRYPSLSHVARAITGTRWSGPRFFGLKQRARAGSGASDVPA